MLRKNVILAIIFIAMFVVPILQVVTAAIEQSTNQTQSETNFVSRNDLRQARAMKWLEWWVITLKRLLGIGPE